MKKTKFYKRKFIVNKPLQYIILLHSLSMVIWISLVNIIFEYLVIGVWGQQHKILLTALVPIAMIIIFLSTILFSIILSNRIAGPIFRLKRHMDELAEGASTPEDVNLRKRDYFSEVFIAYNKVLAKHSDLQKK